MKRRDQSGKPLTIADFNPKISRRRFTKAGAVAPFVLTLGSRSVWGGANCSLSGTMSGNLSNHQHDATPGYGCSPGFWKNHPAAWPEQLRSPLIGATCFLGSDRGPSQKKEHEEKEAKKRDGAEPIRVDCLVYDVRMSFPTLASYVGGCVDDANRSLFEVLQFSPGGLDFQVAAAIVNIIALGPATYGADLAALRQFLCSSVDAGTKTEVLDCMNNRPGMCEAIAPASGACGNVSVKLGEVPLQVLASDRTSSGLCILVVDRPH